MRIPIAVKIVTLTAIAITICCVITLGVTTSRLGALYMEELDTSIRRMQGVVAEYLKVEGKNLLENVNLAANFQGIHETLLAGDTEKAQKIARHMMSDTGTSFVLLTDGKGMALAKARSDPAYDTLTGERLFSDVLKGRPTVGVLSDPVKPYTLYAVSPILQDGRLIGSVSMGMPLASVRLLDRLNHLTGLEISLFRGNERVMTTVFQDGKRALGTRLKDPEVLEQTLKKGLLYQGEKEVFGTLYKTIYWPIRDRDGGIMGMWFIGNPLDEEMTDKNRAMAESFVVAGGLSLLLLFLGAVIGLNLSRPVIRTTNYAVQLAEGNLEAQLHIHSHDEMETLAEALKTMVRALKGRIEEAQKQSALAEEATARAEEAARIKTQFLANMSHEIRTPMNGLIGMSYLALQCKVSPTVRNYLIQIDTSAHTLLNIVNDILDITKIESGKADIKLTPFAIRRIADSLRASLLSEVEKKGLSLFVHVEDAIPEKLVGDNLHLTQVLLNLVGNAVKFTHAGEISVLVELDGRTPEADGVWLCFMVIDTGIGIAQEFLPFLFEPFTQADTSITRRFGGTGLGLSICKRLVEMMGGRIRVESQEGEGTVFSFSLPLKFVPAIGQEDRSTLLPTGPEASKTKTLSPRECRILLVEDNEINREIAQKLLCHRGYKVDTAEDGLEGVYKALSAPYELVLMDIQMPGMDGFKATAFIRERFTAEQLPIIAMTAHAMNGDRDKCLEKDMQDHIPKPFEPERLYSAVEQWTRPLAKVSHPKDRSRQDGHSPHPYPHA